MRDLFAGVTAIVVAVECNCWWCCLLTIMTMMRCMRWRDNNNNHNWTCEEKGTTIALVSKCCCCCICVGHIGSEIVSRDKTDPRYEFNIFHVNVYSMLVIWKSWSIRKQLQQSVCARAREHMNVCITVVCCPVSISISSSSYTRTAAYLKPRGCCCSPVRPNRIHIISS